MTSRPCAQQCWAAWRLDPDMDGRADVLIVSIKAMRAAVAPCAFTGLSRNHLGLLLTVLQPAWTAAREDRLHARRTRARIRKPGAGRRPRPSFTDRVVITWSTCASRSCTPPSTSPTTSPGPPSPRPVRCSPDAVSPPQPGHVVVRRDPPRPHARHHHRPDRRPRGAAQRLPRRRSCWSTPATKGSSETTVTKSACAVEAPTRAGRRPNSRSRGSTTANASPRNGLRSSTPIAERNGGASCNASPAVANSAPRPSTPSPASSPTSPPYSPGDPR